MSKKCSSCKKQLNLNLFNKNKAKPDGLSDSCKECRKNYRSKNKEKIKLQKQESYKRNKEGIRKRWKDSYTKEKKLKKKMCPMWGLNPWPAQMPIFVAKLQL